MRRARLGSGACAQAMGRRQNQLVRLEQPGIMTALWPGLLVHLQWPACAGAQGAGREERKAKIRRRILTNAVAVPAGNQEEASNEFGMAPVQQIWPGAEEPLASSMSGQSSAWRSRRSALS